MSTYIYMRILESAPLRYDRGIQLLSLGRVTTMYDAVARAAVGGIQAPHVLEIGCGTGILTQALLARCAQVTAIDLNPEMLDVARFGYACLRWPLAIVTHHITQTTTTAVQNLTTHSEAAGVCILEEKRLPGGISLIHAERPMEDGRMSDGVA